MRVVFDTNVFLSALAIPSGQADVIVTGDQEMLGFGEYEGVRIVTLRNYLEAL